jgi:hypothetical protein
MSKKQIKVRIDSCKMGSFWYSDKVGTVVVVTDHDALNYAAPEFAIGGIIRLLLKEDVVVLHRETLEIMLKNAQRARDTAEKQISAYMKDLYDLETFKSFDIVAGLKFKCTEISKLHPECVLISIGGNAYTIGGYMGNMFQTYSQIRLDAVAMATFLNENGAEKI